MIAPADANVPGGGPAARQQMTIPRLLITCAPERSGEITAADKRELLTELFVIRRLPENIANNVNQIAKVANSTRKLPQTDMVLSGAWSTLRRADRQIERFGLS